MQKKLFALVIISIAVSSCRTSMKHESTYRIDDNGRVVFPVGVAIADQMYSCQSLSNIWDDKASACFTPKAYCLQKAQDGSIWLGNKCLNLQMQCEERTDNSRWVNGQCLSAVNACKAVAGAVFRGGKCLLPQDLCSAKGSNFFWVQGKCQVVDFLSYCQQITQEAQVEPIIIKLQQLANSKNCKDINSWLPKQTILDLSNNNKTPKINNVGPLADFSNLTKLILSNNNINNISALSKLVKLTSLNLENNRISSLVGLEKLTALTMLYIGNNVISDLTPLYQLTALSTLSAFGNRISNVEPLKNLSKLTTLYLTNNAISDVSSLKSLSNLKTLDLKNNSIKTGPNSTTCPSDFKTPKVLRDYCYSASGS